ncbi:MFS transporter [Variovorax soli]|uniref:DHA2 family multidrug resistance protein n=1 Tax=Variovorax soli TaxID=376815 RepID=A0ABU1ND14_9BURK|nr:MFS transporter [Variovorax soli]MDR6536329.1 DHA2 family multidrug resistance protein [Variovorax soli]
MNTAAWPEPAGMPAAEAGAAKPSKRALAGLAGILLAALMAGLNSRVASLALADIRGALGLGLDDASWLTTAYNAGELIAMPFAAWFAITLSVRRFSLWTLGVCATVAVALPLLQNLDLLLALRFLQGLASGTLIPLLMMVALKSLPPSIRLHGLALYALTATFAPQLSTWLAGHWTDGLFDWRWVYWQIIPLAGIAASLVAWGLPREPIQIGRFREGNWSGMACGVPGLGLIVVALDQGVRLDWFQSPLIAVSLVAGSVLFAVFLLTEWYHPSPFVKLQILERRNLGLGFTLFLFLLVTLTSGSLLPAYYLGNVQDYRPVQMAPVALLVALPQLILGSAVAVLLYQKWVDARIVFASGLALIALACFFGMHLSSDWNRDQFVMAQTLQAVGQPMAVVAMLFLATSVVQPHEGPYVSGLINTLRAFGSLAGVALVAQLMIVRKRFHAEMLLDHAARVAHSVPDALPPSQLLGIVGRQSLVMSVGDAYLVLGVLALLLIPMVLKLSYVPPPDTRAPSATSPVPSPSQG